MYKSFNLISNSDYFHFTLKDTEWDSLLQYLKKEALSCYLKDDELNRFFSYSPTEKREYLENYVLPNVGNIKSGDFGEIFTFYFLLGKYEEENKILIGLKKWMWKDEKNKPAPASDIVLCYLKPDIRPRASDILISAESKMCATEPKPKSNRIQDAIDGADTDRLTRLAYSIAWFESKYERDGLADKAKIIKRFKDPVNHPYKKQHYAFSIIDSNYISEQLSKGFCKKSALVNLFIVTCSNLQDLYEKYFDGILNEN